MKRETLSLKAYRMIKRDILEGRIGLNSVLSERALATQYGFSRTPLRAAVARLEREGVVSRLEGGTLLVSAPSIEDFLEIVELRRLLESGAASRAAERGVSDELSRLRAPMQSYAGGAESTFTEFWSLDERFHLAVARSAGLALLPRILGAQRALARRSTIIRRLDRFAEQAGEHLVVLDAIERGDAAAARLAMSRHFDGVRRRFLDSLALDSLTAPGMRGASARGVKC